MNILTIIIFILIFKLLNNEIVKTDSKVAIYIHNYRNHRFLLKFLNFYVQT